MKIRIYSVSHAFDLKTEEKIKDVQKLRLIDGYTYDDDEEDDCFGYWLIDENDNSVIKDCGISGGYLHFSLDDIKNQLEASVEYNLENKINEKQINSLIEYTIGQCTDGIGSNFSQSKSENFGMFLSLIEEKGIVKYKIIE